MENVLNPTLKELALSSINQKLILQGVGWDFYEQTLKEYEHSNALHFAYDDGFLEVEVPLVKHERANRILQDLVSTVCLEIETEFINVGSTTFRKQEKTKGCEPDTAFYIQNEKQIRGLDEIDLKIHPAPDLVIEIDITSPSLNKLPIYAALGVPEVWLYKGDKVTFHKLFGGVYQEISRSEILPILNSEKATSFLMEGLTISSTSWFKEVRKWINDK